MSLMDWFKGLFARSGPSRKDPPEALSRPRKKARTTGAKRSASDKGPELEIQPPAKKRKKRPASESTPPVSDAGKTGKKRKTKSAAKEQTSKTSELSAPKAKPVAKAANSSAKTAKPAAETSKLSVRSASEPDVGARKSKRSGAKASKKKAIARPTNPELAIKLEKGKKKPAKAEPAPEPAPENGELAFGVQIKEKKAERRKAFRVSISSMQAVVHEEQTSVTVRDVSVVGIGLAAEGAEKLKLGKTFLIDLVDDGAVVAEKMQAKVMRKQPDVVGLMFVEMRRRDEDTLYDIVLREQKRMAERRRKKD